MYADKAKENLVYIYADVNSGDIEDERIYEGDCFYFKCLGCKLHKEELMSINIFIPSVFIYKDNSEYSLPIEDYLLRYFYDDIVSFSSLNYNKNKDKRDQFVVNIQKPSQIVSKRNGIYFDKDKNCFILKLIVQIPLVAGGKRINGEKAIKCFKGLFKVIKSLIVNVKKSDIDKHIKLYQNQMTIRKYLMDNDYVSFIGNGSILPRINDSDLPMLNAIKFKSPKEDEITIRLNDGTCIKGMGIKKGINVIIGGGYSGKSTLLNAIERGIYNHTLNDGREYVITSSNALMCNAEDGRFVNNLNLSLFFKKLPGNNLNNYTSNKASGSVSQASNVIEAINNDSKLILIDEDRSAVNFMYRDDIMRKIIKNEPIISLTERINLIKEKENVSFIIVIGSLSDYLKYADNVIMMDNFLPYNKTKDIENKIVSFDDTKYFFSKKRIYYSKLRLFISENVIDNKILVYDDIVLDITKLSSIISYEQVSFLQFLIKSALMYIKKQQIDLNEFATYLLSKIDDSSICEVSNVINENTSMFFEEIRKIDLISALLRIKSLKIN